MLYRPHPAGISALLRFFCFISAMALSFLLIRLFAPADKPSVSEDRQQIASAGEDPAGESQPEGKASDAPTEKDSSEAILSLTENQLSEEALLTQELVYYNQKSDEWKDCAYGENDVGNYGCGPTACAILLSTLLGEEITPAEMADWAVENGCYIQDGGSYHMIIPLACRSYGLSVTGYSSDETDQVLKALKEGALVGVIMGPGHFTQSGHFIVLYGITEDGKLMLADPASESNTNTLWDPETVFSEAKSYAQSGGPFWVVTNPET